MNKISVVFICDNGFVVQTATAITSLILNKNTDTYYDIYIIGADISEENKKQLELLAVNKCKIVIINGNTQKFINLHKYREGGYLSATEAALLKFDLPQLLPNLEKVLYLDGDVIVTGDLSELFNTDVNYCYAAAAHDTGKLYSDNSFNQKYSDYFNSGVMLLNLQLMRDDDITNKLIECKKSLNDRNLMDQNVLNTVFTGKVKLIDIKWNFLILNLERAKERWDIQQLNEKFNSDYKNFNDIKKHAVIFHFASKEKPWMFSNTPYAKLWIKYYKKSPFGHIKLRLNKLQTVISLSDRFFSVRSDKNFHKTIRFLGLKLKLYSKRDAIVHLKAKLKQLESNNQFLQTKLNRFESLYSCGINKEKVQYQIDRFENWGLNVDKREHKIIASLTSYPARLYDLHYAIYSLLTQTVKPDELILWLGEEQFPNRENDIGENILALRKYGLTIKWTKDIKSYKKLIPALKEYRNDLIITFDDDVYYDKDCIKDLYFSYLNSSRDCIIAKRCHKIKFEDNLIWSYKLWEKCVMEESCSYLNFFTGVGGVLYPPNCLHKNIFNEDEFKLLAPNADDIWFWAMAVLNGTKIKVSQNPISSQLFVNPQRELNLNDDGTLYSSNCKADGNDLQLKNIIDEYPQIIDILDSDRSICS